MAEISAWRQAGRHLVAHWLPWLVLLLLTSAAGTLVSLLALPHFLTQSPATAILQPATAGRVLTRFPSTLFPVFSVLLPLEVIVGSFLVAAQLALLKDAADLDLAPTFPRYFARGWEFWSWTWRGFGFGCMVGLAIYLANVIVALAFARARYAPQKFRLFVAAFNERAITAYTRLGFRVTGEETRHLLGRDWRFLCLERPA